MCIYIWNLPWEVCVKSKVKMYICGVSMRRPVKVFRFTFLYLFFYVICIGYNMLYASSTEENNTTKIPKWSLEFNDCSVSDALDQISRFTGVNVFTNKGVDRMILKNYKDKTIDYIVTDMLSRENYAMIRRFNDKKKLISIGIWILDRSHGSSIVTNNPFANVVPNNPFEAGSIEGNPFANIVPNNPFEAGHIERNIKNGNKK